MKTFLIFPRLVEQVHGMWPPLGVLTLGTILKNQGHEVRCFDLSFDRDLTRIEAELEQGRPELVGVACLTDFFQNASSLVKFAKARGAVTVMGGPHPTIDPMSVMACLPELDYALTGEAEESLPALIAAIKSGAGFRDIPGLAFCENGAAVYTGPPQPVHDLDAIPIPDRGLFEANKHYLRARAINLHASRGCPFHCRFCQPTLEKLFGRALRLQSPARVATEIAHYHKLYGIRDYFFHDDTFTVNKKWLAGLAGEFDKQGLIKNFRYVVNSRVDTFDRERAALLKKMGVYYVLFGIESGSQEILDSLNKGTTIEQAREAFAICRESGFRTHAYVLLGSPRETKDSLRATEDFLAEIRPSTVHVSIFTPLPGTELAAECEREGRILIHQHDEFDYYLKKTSSGNAPIKIPGLEYQDLLASRQRILDRRKAVVFFDNLLELVRDILREPSLDKLIFRFQSYRRMQHYFG